MGNCDFRSVQNEDKDVVLDNNTNTKQSDNATKARSGAVHTFLDDNNVANNEERNLVSNIKEDGPEQTPTFDFERKNESEDANEKRHEGHEVDEVIQSNYEPIQNNENNDEHANDKQDDSFVIECTHYEDLNQNDHFKTKSKIKTENARNTINHS